jgi:hypothetical protein
LSLKNSKKLYKAIDTKYPTLATKTKTWRGWGTRFCDLREVLDEFLALQAYFFSWYSISVLISHKFALSVMPFAMLSTAVMAVSMEWS